MYKCDLCYKLFDRKFNLLRHVNKKTKCIDDVINDSDFSEANNDIQDYNLDYDFEDENDLYLDTEQEKANWLEYI